MAPEPEYTFTHPFEELDGSPRISRTDDGYTIRVKWKVLYADAQEFIDEVFNEDSPHLPEKGARCREISYKPFPSEKISATDANAELAESEHALVTAVFQAATGLTFEEIGDGYLTNETFENTVEAIPIPADTIRWASDNKEVSEDSAPVFHLYGATYVLTHKNIEILTVPGTYTLYGDLSQHIGKVNKDRVTPFMFPFIHFDPGTLLVKPILVVKANEKFTVTYRFGIRFSGWNKAYRSDTQAFDSFVLPMTPGEEGSAKPWLNYKEAAFTLG